VRGLHRARVGYPVEPLDNNINAIAQVDK
jgi:hypothetical protein